MEANALTAPGRRAGGGPAAFHDAFPGGGNAVAEVLSWCIPALVVGAFLRCCIMLGWGGGFYYGYNSGDYIDSVFEFFRGGALEIKDRRPWGYPWMFMVACHGPVSPGWTAALVQHALGLSAVIPLAAMVRTCLVRWRVWVVPVTLLFACYPAQWHWEHVLIPDGVFAAAAVWSCWLATRYWQRPGAPGLAAVLAVLFVAATLRPLARILWLCVVPLAALAPGRRLAPRMWHTGIVLLLFPVLVSATKATQGKELLFASVFPFIEQRGRGHEEVRAELAPIAAEHRRNLWKYVVSGQEQVLSLMHSSNVAKVGPAWQALRKDKKAFARFLRDLSFEALTSHPFDYARLVALKIYQAFSSDPVALRFEPSQYVQRSVKFLDDRLEFAAFLLRDPSVTTRERLKESIAGQVRPGVGQSAVMACVGPLTAITSLYELPESDSVPGPGAVALVCLVLAGLVAVPFHPRWRLWLPALLMGAAYTALTFFVARAVGRYRLPVDFIWILLLFVAPDTILAIRGRAPSGAASEERGGS